MDWYSFASHVLKSNVVTNVAKSVVAKNEALTKLYNAQTEEIRNGRNL